jgi:2-oxoisovalerate dehydrogenase E1 component
LKLVKHKKRNTLKAKEFLELSGLSAEDVKMDYHVACLSRNTSEIGRKEVFMGKAKFGIFGGGKEVPQVALSHFFEEGDFRSGYYRDQTLMFRIGAMTPQQLFAQLYAHTDIAHEPVSGGRLMTGHFGTRLLNEDGTWKNLTKAKNSSTDISPTAAQMPRLVGLAYASKLYRENKNLPDYSNFSNNGNEVAFGTIGNASCAEGMFFESINAIGVMRCPALISIWDDGYGISVPNDIQFTKGNVWELLQGFKKNELADSGYVIEQVKGWDYPTLVLTYKRLTKICRELHIPVIVHVDELTQPGGHSTSGSHERYKSEDRLKWELEYDCLKKMREWLLSSEMFSEEELQEIEKNAALQAKQEKDKAWKAYTSVINQDRDLICTLLDEASPANLKEVTNEMISDIKKKLFPQRSDFLKAVKEFFRQTPLHNSEAKTKLIDWHTAERKKNHQRYSSWLHAGSLLSAIHVKEVKPIFSNTSREVDGREVLQEFFQKAMAKEPHILAFGEDVGKIGDVNQAFAGLQEIFGENRVFDTGIRECSIIGQAIGLAMRGFRPIAEIQYLDYMMYALQIISDDLATLQYRTVGGQKAPVIIRTRGHRLEGVWHSGSPMGAIIHSVRGVYVCVPRNMVQASGMYNTLLKGDEPAIVVECLNGYRKKELLPDNLVDFTVPLGQVEVLRAGTDITIVTYGSMCHICIEAAERLMKMGISAEVIDIQTLLPFDLNHDIVKSLAKTNKVLFADEDVPGGATAYMMQKVLEEQSGYLHLDLKPKTIHSWAHRPAYATDGDYFSKPNPDDVVEYVYKMFWEDNPAKYPALYW